MPLQHHLVVLGLSTALILSLPVEAAIFSRSVTQDKQRQLFEEAEKAEINGKFKRAAKVYRKLLSSQLLDTEQTRADIQVRRGDALFRAGSWEAAYLAYKKAIMSYPMYAPYEHVLEQLRFLSHRFAEGDASILGFKNLTRAIEIQKFVLDHAPAGAKAASDKMRLARLQYMAGLLPEAAATYRGILQDYSASEQALRARLELARILIEMAEEQPNKARPLRNAEQHLETLLRAQQSDAAGEDEAQLLLNVVHELQAKELYDLGEFYLGPEHRRLQAARRYLNELVHEYPQTSSAALARIMLARVGNAQDSEPPKRPQAGTKEQTATTAPAEVMIPENVIPPAEPATGKNQEVKKWLRPLEDIRNEK